MRLIPILPRPEGNAVAHLFNLGIIGHCVAKQVDQRIGFRSAHYGTDRLRPVSGVQ